MAGEPAEFEMVAALRVVVNALDTLKVPYLVGGSVASSVYGDPRATRDVDIVADFRAPQASPFVDMLSGEFYADLPTILLAIENRGSFNAIHLETMVKVDVFVAKPNPFTRSQLARRQARSIGDTESVDLFFASAEDTVLAKLDWYRQGGSSSDRQWNDVLGVLKVQAERLDREYLRHWARELSVTDLLGQALADAGLD